MGLRASLVRLQSRGRAALDVLLGPEQAIADQRLRPSLGLSPYVLTFNPDDLVGRKGLSIYEKMRRDEQVKACLAIKKAAILGPGWTLEPATEDERDAVLAETLTDDLQKLPGSFRAKLWCVLSALEFGFSITEKIAEVRERRIVLANLKTRAPYDFEFELDPFGNVTSIRQRQLGGSLADLPPEKFIHYRHQDEFGNPYGRSDLYEAYVSWWHKTHWRQWLSIWGERLAVPPVVGKHPPNASQATIDQVLTLLNKMQSTTTFTVPESWELSLLESARNPKGTFTDVIDHLDLRIARAILLPDKMGLSGGEVKAGSFALATAQLGVWFTVIDFLREGLAELVQENMIADMAALENPAANPPLFRLLPLGDEDKQAIVAAWISAASGGAVEPTPRDEQHLRQMLEFPELTDDELAERQEDQDMLRERRRNPPPVPVPPGGNGEEEAQRGEPAGGAPTPNSEMVALIPSRGIVGTPALQPPEGFWRALRPVEMRAKIGEKRDLLESASSALALKLATVSETIVEDLRTRVRKGKLLGPKASLPAIRNLRLNQRIATEAHRAMGAELQAAYSRARRQAVGEVRRARRKFAAPDPMPGLVGTRAERYFGHKAIWVTDVLIEDVLRQVQQRLFAALKQDKTERQILFELDEVLTPFLPIRNRAGAIVNIPQRLEVIARTNISEAVNEGRWALFSDPDVRGVVEAVQYTAILDNRVRDSHAAWDGVTLPVDHEVWFGPPDRRPPNGFSCRCMLIPVIAGDPDTEITSPADIPTIEVVDAGFK